VIRCVSEPQPETQKRHLEALFEWRIKAAYEEVPTSNIRNSNMAWVALSKGSAGQRVRDAVPSSSSIRRLQEGTELLQVTFAGNSKPARAQGGRRRLASDDPSVGRRAVQGGEEDISYAPADAKCE